MDKLFEELIGAFGVSGHEEEVRGVIVEYLNSINVDNSIDTMGNVIASIGKNKGNDKYMVAAHMDTMGFIVLYIEENGALRIGKIGNFSETSFINNMVEFENGNSGRLCITKKDGSINDMYIDLGVSSREEALEIVKEGDVCMVTSNVIEEEKNILAPALDNRVGCYATLKALEKLMEKESELNKEVYFVFSTQKKLGARGVRSAAAAIKPDYALAVDGELSEDNLEGSGKLPLGKGTGVRFMDKSMLIHYEVKEQLEKVYESLGKTPKFIFSEEFSDGKTIHIEGAGTKTGALVYPVRYKDTNIEMINYKDMEETIDVIYNYIML